MPGVESIRFRPPLKDLQRDLRRVNSQLPKELRLVNLAAANLIAEGTQASFSGRGGVAPKVAASVRAMAQQRSAQVRIGGNKYPFALGSEFGSVRFKQFGAWRGSGADAGYSLYETVRRRQAAVVALYADRVEALARTAFPS